MNIRISEKINHHFLTESERFIEADDVCSHDGAIVEINEAADVEPRRLDFVLILLFFFFENIPVFVLQRCVE